MSFHNFYNNPWPPIYFALLTFKRRKSFYAIVAAIMVRPLGALTISTAY